jgi:hypothetical protein
MNSKNIAAVVILAVSCSVPAYTANAAQDRFTLKAPNGVSFSDIKGYENWQDVAVSRTPTGIKVILGNPIMIKAYREGIPGNGKPFPEGAKIVKIAWAKKVNPVSPYAVEVPDTVQWIAFIEKDSKRFPDTSGWGYAQFNYDPASKTFSAYGKDSTFGKTVCYKCHTIVAARNYIFTNYPFR